MKSKIINRVRKRQADANFRKLQEEMRRPEWMNNFISKKIEEARQRMAVRSELLRYPT
jgi:hypothetical protein